MSIAALEVLATQYQDGQCYPLPLFEKTSYEHHTGGKAKDAWDPAFGGGLVFWDATCAKSGPGRGVGWGVLGFVQLALHDHTAETTSALEREVMAMPQVLSCHNLSGRYDYQLEVVAADLESFADYVRTHVRSLPGVREISTSFSLKEVKRTMALPV